MNAFRNAVVSAALVLGCGLSAQAQNPIANPSFETWSEGNPVDWGTSNDGFPGSVTQTADAHSGSWAARGDVQEIFPGLNAGAMVQTGDMGNGFATTTRWGALEGWYKFNSVNGDQIILAVILMKNSEAIAGGSMVITSSAATYQKFTLPIFYNDSTTTPDSGLAYAFLFGPPFSETPSLGSYFIFDDWAMVQGAPPGCPVALTGDVNLSGNRNTTDIIYLANHVLKAGAAPQPCRAAGDVNCDGTLNLTDIIYLVNSVLRGGPAPCDVCSIIPSQWSCP